MSISPQSNMEGDEAFGRVVYEEVGILTDLGYLWPRYNGKMYAYSVLYFSLMILFALSALVSFVYLVDDLHVLFLNVNYFLLLLLAISLPIFWASSRGLQTEMFQMVIDGFYEYQIAIPAEVRRELRRKVRKELNVFTTVLISSAISGCIVVFSPNIDSYFGETQNKTHDYIAYNLPLHVYLPFQLHQFFWSRMTVLFSEAIIVVFVVLTILSSELFFVKFCQRLFYEQEILIWALKNLKARVRMMTNESEEFWLDFCLTENIRHHQRIKRFSKVYDQLTSPMLLSAWCLGTTAIALSLFEAVLGTASLGKMLSSSSLTISEVLNVFILSRMGQHLIDLGEEIFEEVRFLPWYEFSIRARRNHLIFLSGTLNADLLKAGNMIPMNYDSFATAMNTAYSYFNVLKARKIG